MKVKKIISLFMAIIMVASMFAGVTFAVTNTDVNADEVEMIEVSVMKIWDDYNDFDSLRPEKINATLKQNDKVLTEVTLSKENNWYYKYDKPVEKYDSNGNEFKYTWECEEIDGYSRVVDTLDTMTLITDVHHITSSVNDTITLQKLDENNDFLDQCKLRVLDNNKKELFSWISGDESSIKINDNTISVTMNKDGSVIVNGLPNGEYIYEEILPKSGYTTAKSKEFKIEKAEHTYSFNWYTSLDSAVTDANNLVTDNADCNRDDEKVEAGLFIVNNIAHLILLKDVTNVSTFGLNQNTVFDLDTHKISFASANGLQYCSDLKLLDGTIGLSNIARGINGLVSTTYQSTGKLYMDNMTVNHTSNIGGTRTINTYASDTKIEDCRFNISYSAGGYGLMFPNTAGKAVFKNNEIIVKNSGTSTMYTFNSSLNTLELEGNNIETSSGKAAYCVYASGTNLNVKSGDFKSTSSGGNALNIYALKSNIIVDYMKGYAKSTATSGWTQGIYIGGDKSTCTINDCYIETMGTKYHNVALYIGEGADVKVYGGYLYSLPIPNGRENDAYGAAVLNYEKCLFEERDHKLVVSGGNCAVQCSQDTTTIFNSGTFKSPNHGGAFITSGSKGHCEINGGEFINDYSDYDQSVVGDYNNGGIHNFAALYVCYQSDSTHTSTDWAVNIRNAKIYGGATWGIALKGDGAFIPGTVNLYDTYVEGSKADIWVSNYANVHKYNAFVNLYDGTTLGHNIVYDQYNVHNNEPHVIDYRTDAKEFETIVQ